MAKKQIAVKIAGQRYVLRSEDDETYVRTLAAFVDQQIEEVQRSRKPIAPHRLAVLAALNIADELFQEQQRRVELKHKIRDRSRAVLRYLDKEVRKRQARADKQQKSPLHSS